MRLRIVSNGHSSNSHVENADTGERVENVVSVTWTCHAALGSATATIELRDVAADVIGDAPHTHAPMIHTL